MIGRERQIAHRMSQPSGVRPRYSPIINNQSSIINPRAFTLIELLVVISVIALLMAILIPTLQRARNQARTVTCRSNLRQWAMTLAAYTQDYEGRLPSDPTGQSALWMLRGTFVGNSDPTVAPRHPRHFPCHLH